MYCILFDDIDFAKLCCIQEHLNDVYMGTARSCYVEQYGRACSTRVDRWNRQTSGGWRPLVEHDDIVSVAVQVFIVRNVCCCICGSDRKRFTSNVQ